MSTIITLVVWAQLTCAAPLDVTLSAIWAALEHQEDPVTLISYACSEHKGGRWSGACSDEGACGPFQLMPLWPRHFGYELDAREEPLPAAAMTAQLFTYSRDRHEHCDGDHTWRAHIKCSRSSRDSCGSASRWMDLEEDLRELLVDPGDS